ncbi:MAG: hypothetical protein JO100_17920 [Pseudonocardia sp.]|nr:hypothetical protein [Pseudonocardia sp.]
MSRASTVQRPRRRSQAMTSAAACGVDFQPPAESLDIAPQGGDVHVSLSFQPETDG